MYLSSFERYCLSLTPQRSKVQKSHPRRTGELASMSASAAESTDTDCTGAALGAVESKSLEDCLPLPALLYNNQQPHFHREPEAAYARGWRTCRLIELHTQKHPRMPSMYQIGSRHWNAAHT